MNNPRSAAFVMFYAFTSLATLPFSVPAVANSAPKQLYNKSIFLFWSESNSSKRLSDDSAASGTIQHTRVIYVSEVGRAFVRATSVAGSSSFKSEKGPESAMASFVGTSLVFHGQNGGIAREFRVTFDPNFLTCVAAVVVGKSGPSPKLHGPDGALYELISIAVGSSSCSIRDGNAFTQ